MQKSFLFVLIFMAASGWALASTVDLNDGRTVQGDIVKQDNKSLQITVDGVNMTYYADEIKDIDGKPFAAQQPSPAAAVQAPAPVAAPDVDQAQPAAPQAAPQADSTAPVAAPEPFVAPAQPVVPIAPAASASTIDPEKKALILKFMEVFGTRQALTNNFNAMLIQIAKEKPDEAQTIRQRVKVDEIVDLLVPIYDRNFSSEDLKAFNAFYGSDEGQKLIHTIPELMKESITESVKYMREKFPEINGAKQ